MTHHILSTVRFIVFVSLAAPSYAAEPKFKIGRITESRTYDREELVKSEGLGDVMPIRVSINRVTVALEGERITGEWKPARFYANPMSTAKALAEDFRTALTFRQPRHAISSC